MKKRGLLVIFALLISVVAFAGCSNNKNESTPVVSTFTVTSSEASNNEYLISFSGAISTDENSASYVEGATVGIVLTLGNLYDINEVVVKSNGQVIEKQSQSGNIANYSISGIRENLLITVENVIYIKYDVLLDYAKDKSGNILSEEMYDNILLSTEDDKNFKEFNDFIEDITLNMQYNNILPIYLKQKHVDAYNVDKLVYFILHNENYNNHFPDESTLLEVVKFKEVEGSYNLYIAEIRIQTQNEYSLYFDTNNEAYGNIENGFVVQFPHQSEMIEVYAIDDEGNKIDDVSVFRKAFSENFKFVAKRAAAFSGEEFDSIFENVAVNINGSEIDIKFMTVNDETINYYQIDSNTVPTSFQQEEGLNKFKISVTGLDVEGYLTSNELDTFKIIVDDKDEANKKLYQVENLTSLNEAYKALYIDDDGNKIFVKDGEYELVIKTVPHVLVAEIRFEVNLYTLYITDLTKTDELFGYTLSARAVDGYYEFKITFNASTVNDFENLTLKINKIKQNERDFNIIPESLNIPGVQYYASDQPIDSFLIYLGLHTNAHKITLQAPYTVKHNDTVYLSIIIQNEDLDLSQMKLYDEVKEGFVEESNYLIEYNNYHSFSELVYIINIDFDTMGHRFSLK